MHKKCSWKLGKIPCNVKPIETAANGLIGIFACELLVYVSNNPINIRYFEWVYYWKISIFNLKMEFWLQ